MILLSCAFAFVDFARRPGPLSTELASERYAYTDLVVFSTAQLQYSLQKRRDVFEKRSSEKERIVCCLRFESWLQHWLAAISSQKKE